MRPRPDQILSRVAEAYGVTVADLRGRSRKPQIVQARQAAMLALRRLTDLSSGEIGEQLDGRDHSTVLYGAAQAEARLLADDDFRRRFDLVIALPRVTPPARPAPRRIPGVRHYAKVSAA